jgi:ABC-type phosphate/phosphonate transport system substrate-binding protein
MRLGIFLALMLMVLVFVGCSNEASKPEANEASKPEANEASKLEAEIVNPESFVTSKNVCEGVNQALGSNTGLGDCVERVFETITDEFCEKKGFELMGTTCIEARKRVRQRVREYLANPPKLSGDK